MGQDNDDDFLEKENPIEEKKDDTINNDNNENNNNETENEVNGLELLKDYKKSKAEKPVKKSYEEKRKERQEKINKEKKAMKFKLAISLAVFVVVCVVGIFAYIKYNTIDLKSYELLQNLFEEQIFDKEVYVDGKKSMFLNAPIKNENDIYIPVSFVANNLKNNILYDQENGILSIATDFDRIKILNGEKAYYVNGEKTNLSKEAIIEKEKNAFISSELIEKFYNFNFEYAEKYDSYCFESTLTAKKTGSISENDKLYNYKGEPLKILNKTGDKVNVSVSEGDQISIYFEENNLVKIRTSDGVVGFVPKDIISNEKVKEVEEKVKTSEPKVIDKDSNAIILFEQVSNKSANYLATQKEIPKGVDVLVPTWFSFNKTNDGTDGKIISLADENYVKFAHQKGRKVWGLITDNFDTDISRSVVKSAITREKVVNQLTSIVKKYNLDGINIDFENIPNDSMTEFTQFLRELSASLNNLDVYLSIDVYIPTPWTKYYNRKEFGEIVDYFIVMGYDEHTESSDECGSVATKKWSEDSITLTEDAGVPKEKLILGVPFYTRIWKETLDGKIETRACSMQEGYKEMIEKGATFKWISEIGQNYAEINTDQGKYKMWLEDEKSIEERLKLIKKYDIAGFAAWRRGYEKPTVWPVINKYMKG